LNGKCLDGESSVMKEMMFLKRIAFFEKKISKENRTKRKRWYEYPSAA
jgi:hypothetical protein